VDASVEKGTPVDLEACFQKFFGEEYAPDFQSAQIAMQRLFCWEGAKRMNSFPKV